MAEALKTFFSPALAERLARSLAIAWPAFPEAAFVRRATRGLASLELLDRARHLAAAMAEHLPSDYPEALAIVLRSLGPEHAGDELEGVGMEPFFYLPHVIFVAERGLDHFELSMDAQHALTRRFTCEFSIRPFLAREPARTLAVLARWAVDPNPHVRRLVSEGTRPRLPWAPRVKWLEEQPERTLPLLEALKDDPTTLVRRSVANHLNDLYKSSPARVVELAGRWLDGASEPRRALVKHALRTAVKKGDRGALALLGFGGRPRVRLDAARFTPARVAIGGRTRFEATLTSTAARGPAQQLSVDLIVHFVKARGATSAKVFKLAQLELAPEGTATLRKSISLAEHTTRTPYPGAHAVELLVNGERFEAGAFDVRER